MTLTGLGRRQLALVLALLAAAAIALGGHAKSATSAPGQNTGDAEGGTAELRKKLNAAASAYNDAKGRLDTSKASQAQATQQVQTATVEVERLTKQVGALAAYQYRSNRMGKMGALLDAGSPEGLVESATTVQYLSWRDDTKIRELRAANVNLAKQRKGLDSLIATQQAAVVEMAKQVKAAEQALIAVGGSPGSGPGAGGPVAKPAPRNPDGSWPKESCTQDDPTTTRCLTPRTLHALNEAKANGFTRHTGCNTGGTWGEHPVGRACDFAAATSGYGKVATGADKAYGDRLASFFLSNSSRLGVMYVIWYRQIWMPGTGWRSYSGGGSPSGDHTDHVHLSVQ